MEWASILTALSTAAIAVVAIGITIFALPTLRQIGRVSAALEQLLIGLERDAKPLLESTKALVTEAGEVATKLRTEVHGIIETSQDVRERVIQAADAAEDRLLDLEALVEVLQDEFQETALDVAAALRTTRRGASIIGAMKRAFLGPGKKKRRRRR